VDPAKDDHVPLDPGGRLGEGEGVAHHVRQILDLGFLVEMGEQNRVLLLLQAENLPLQIRGEDLFGCL
jgi:hypothetical protein